MPSADNKRIAKNTIVLYVRMLVSIVLNLYTVRLLWQILGIDNYGIYNVVGGIVMMFAFLNNAMVASSQRFISYELGKGDAQRLKTTFSVSVSVHVVLAIIVLILAETVGLWFVNDKLNIPEGRMAAANWVYQCSVFSFLMTVVSVPYNACIVAHEHINIYGYFGILEVVLKLVIVLILFVIPFDKLISYAVMILMLAILMRSIYVIYCKMHFAECHWKNCKDKELIRQMFDFAGWSFIGNMGFTVRDQGINILINLFFNVAVNAAKGVANQIGAVIGGFANNFTMALNPQITKRYAGGEIDSMLELVYRGCKYSLLLMSIIVIPLYIAADSVLYLWLGDVAPYTVGFLRLILIMSLVDCVVSPITTSIQATGKIRKFQILVSIIMVCTVPFAWLLLKLGGDPYTVMYAAITASMIALVSRVMLLHELVPISYIRMIKTVYAFTLPCMIITGIAMHYLYPLFTHSVPGLMMFGFSSCVMFSILAFFIALSHNERRVVISQIKRKAWR